MVKCSSVFQERFVKVLGGKYSHIVEIGCICTVTKKKNDKIGGEYSSENKRQSLLL